MASNSQNDYLTRRLVALFRSIRFVLHLSAGLTIALIYPWFRLETKQRILQAWSAKLLRIFNVHIQISKDDLLRSFRHGLIVTNHVSWLDVFVLNSVIPMRFVAKSEVRQWPIIGWLCARAQTLFIERGKVRSAARINAQMINLLKEGESLAIFPEGTTTDGKQVSHFHSSLLQPAIDAGVQVLPVSIRYQNEFGTHSTAPAYIDDISFGASLWNILNTAELHVRLVASTPTDTGLSDRRELTHIAYQSISTTLNSMHATLSCSPSCDVDHIQEYLCEAELHS